MQHENYDFPVEFAPVFTTGTLAGKEIKIAMPKKLAVVRTDTNQSLGIVSDKYAFLKHSDVVDGFRKALAGQEFTESINLQRDGAQLYAKYTLKGVSADVQKGDLVGMQLTARNSYDGSAQLHLSLGAMRLVCKNGMVMTKNFVEFSHKHIGTALTLDVAEVKSNIEMMMARFKESIPHMQNMSRTNLHKAEDELFNKNLKIPTYLLEEAKESFKTNGDSTVWGFYNALTFAITHKMRKEAPALATYYGQLAWSAAFRELV